MFENILHAPLQRHSGVTAAAHSLLEGLLERDVSKRLGGSRDLVSWKNGQQRTTQHTDWSASNFSVFPGGAAGAFFLWIYKLDWPPRQEGFTPLHPERGKYHPSRKDNSCHINLSAHSVFIHPPPPVFQTGPCDVSYIDPEFTLQPVPASLNERCQACATSDTFQGFSFMNPVEYVVS